MKTSVKSIVLVALLAPTLSFAAGCEHAQPRSLPLDLTGVRTVRIEVNANELNLVAQRGATPGVTARACASDPARFDQLTLSQERQGDVLVIRAEREGYSVSWSKPDYAYLQLEASLPADLAYDVRVGSGDASVSNLPNVRIEVGSGDATVRGASGVIAAKVGSGDLAVFDAGSLELTSLGSGDVEATGVRGDVNVDSIGSGDLTVEGVDGSVAIGRIGSGDARISTVAGTLTVSGIGSGNVTHRGVRGPVKLPPSD